MFSIASSRDQSSDPATRVSGERDYSRKLINMSDSIRSIKSALSHMKIKDDDKNFSDVSPDSTATVAMTTAESRETTDDAFQRSLIQGKRLLEAAPVIFSGFQP